MIDSDRKLRDMIGIIDWSGRHSAAVFPGTVAHCYRCPMFSFDFSFLACSFPSLRQVRSNGFHLHEGDTVVFSAIAFPTSGCTRYSRKRMC